MQFGLEIKTLRIRAGYPSAKPFHKELVDKVGLNMTYSNYTRVEKGQTNPPLAAVIKIARFLQVADFSSFIKTYLQESLPKGDDKDYFSSQLGDLESKNNYEHVMRKQMSRYHKERQVELTKQQMEAVIRDSDYYALFLAFILAGRPLNKDKIYEKTKVDLVKYNLIISTFKGLGILLEENNTISAFSSHIRFPRGYRDKISSIHKELANKKSDPYYSRAIFLKTTTAQMEKFNLRLKELENEFMTYEQVDPRLNDKVFLLSINLFDRLDLNISES